MSRTQSQEDDYFVCPHCGADVPVHAAFCRECGASDESGWDDDHDLDVSESTGYGDGNFDYDDFINREYPQYGDTTNRYKAKQWFVGLIVVVLCLALLLFMLAN
jgi:hypothetical protein